MDNKQLGILSSPLKKIEQAAELTNRMLFSILELNTISTDRQDKSLTELEKQTGILESIDNKISLLVGASSSGSKLGKGKGKKAKGKQAALETPTEKLKIDSEDIDNTAQMVIAITGAIFIAAVIFQALPTISPIQILTALAIAAAFAIITPSFVKIAESLNKIKLGKEGKTPSGTGDMWQTMGASLLTMVGLSAAIALSSLAFMLIAPISLAQAGTAVLISLALIGLSMAFVQILTAFRKGKIKTDANGVKTVAMAGIVMVSLSVAVAMSSWILQTIIEVDPMKLFTAFLIGAALIPISFAFGLIVKNLKKANLKQVLLASLAIPLIAVGISMAAHIFNAMLPDTYKAPPTEWVLLTGFTVAVFALSFYLVGKAVKGLNLGQLLFASLAIPLIAIAVVGTAFVLQLLGSVKDFIAPPPEWALKTGLALIAFSIPFAIIAIVIGKFNLGFKELMLGILGVVATSLAIVGVAFIFQLLSYVDEYLAPEVKWATAAGAAILAFAIPLIAIGFIAKSGGGAAALGLGLLGVVLTAVAIGLVALIFAGIGNISGFKSGMQNVVDVLFMPMKGMIDILKRLKDEIGIENLGPLAGGILKIAGAWLALTASMAGSALGSAAAGAAAGFIEGIASIFGVKKSKTPFDLLNLLVENSKEIVALSVPFVKVAESFKTIAGNVSSVVSGLGAFIPFMNKEKSEQLVSSSYAVARIAQGYNVISKASNSMNIEAIKETRYMFDALAKIANSPNDNPLAKLSEDLLESIKQLTGIVNNLEQAVGTQSSSTSFIAGVIKKAGDTIDSVKQKVVGSTEAASSGGEQIDVSSLIAAINELEDRLNQPIYTIEVED